MLLILIGRHSVTGRVSRVTVTPLLSDRARTMARWKCGRYIMHLILIYRTLEIQSILPTKPTRCQDDWFMFLVYVSLKVVTPIPSSDPSVLVLSSEDSSLGWWSLSTQYRDQFPTTLCLYWFGGFRDGSWRMSGWMHACIDDDSMHSFVLLKMIRFPEKQKQNYFNKNLFVLFPRRSRRLATGFIH